MRIQLLCFCGFALLASGCCSHRSLYLCDVDTHRIRGPIADLTESREVYDGNYSILTPSQVTDRDREVAHMLNQRVNSFSVEAVPVPEVIKKLNAHLPIIPKTKPLEIQLWGSERLKHAVTFSTARMSVGRLFCVVAGACQLEFFIVKDKVVFRPEGASVQQSDQAAD